MDYSTSDTNEELPEMNCLLGEDRGSSILNTYEILCTLLSTIRVLAAMTCYTSLYVQGIFLGVGVVKAFNHTISYPEV